MQRVFSTFHWVRSVAVFVGINTLAGMAAAQNYGQWPIDLGQRGFVPGAAFDISNLDSVNPVNGNVIMNIPLASLPAGRAGSGLNVGLIYNSLIFDTTTMWVLDNGQPPYAFHSDNILVPLAAGTPWTYAFDYGLYEEFRPGEPVVITDPGTGQTLLTDGCVYYNPPTPDLYASTQPSLYPVRVQARFPDGSSHVLVLQNSTAWGTSEGWMGIDWGGFVRGCNGETRGSFPLTFITQDGTFVRVTISGLDSNSNPIWTMVFPDGRRVMGSGNGTEQIVDRNGNAITISRGSSHCYSLQNASDSPALIQDSFGRCIQMEFVLNTDGTETDLITQAGVGGVLLVTKVTWSGEPFNFTYDSCQIGYEGQCDPGQGVPPTQCAIQGTCAPAYSPMQVVSNIDLSQAGFTAPLNYQFTYGNTTDGQGHPICFCQGFTVALPRGSGASWPSAAQIQYTFSAPDVVQFNPPLSVAGEPVIPVTAKTLTHTDPYTGAAYTDTWQYGSAGITNPDGSITSYFFYAPGTAGPLDGHTYKIEKKDPSGNLLSRDEQMWAENLDAFGSPGPNVYLKADVHSVVPRNAAAPSLAAIRVSTLDVNGNLLEVDESDWVSYSSVGHDSFGAVNQLPSITSGTAARSTINTYYVLADTGANAANGYWSASAPLILTAKKSVEILSSGSPTTYSEFVYDDATGTGSNPGSGAANVTQEWRWDSVRAATFPGATQSGQYSLMLSASTAVETIRTYTAGDLLSETDPRNSQRVFQYNSSAHPYPTDLFEASGSPVQQHWEFGWDPASGLRTSETDPNNSVTTAGYDPRGRMTLFDQAAGLRHTSTTYDDSAQTATTTRYINSNGGPQTVTSTDDLGRAWKTESTDGSCAGGIQTIDLQQTPASGGLAYKLASNPFCALTDPTMGWTQTKSDPLGRVVQVAHFAGAGLPGPWGSNGTNSGAVETSYDANQYTMTDEAGVSRTMTENGLDQLGSVLDGSGITTSYTYDPLNNLTGVTQGGQQRSFVYTSLGRLKSATNPENGTINYTWDDSGNLATRSDARVSFSMNSVPYDALNRPVIKSYSDGTPAVTYCYDGQTYAGSPGQCIGTKTAPLISRLTQVASSVSTTSYSNYDLVGRVVASTQTTNGQSYPFSYSYNMLDGLTSEGFPSGRTVSYTYDPGGRVNTVSGSIVDGQPTTTAYAGTSTNPITYTAHHALSMLPLGSGITESWSYNDRLQPTGVTAGSLILNFYPCDGGGTVCSNNNGNIWRETIQSPGLTATVSQEYRYDAVTRLVVAVENAATGVTPNSTCASGGGTLGGSWCQQFGYDMYGNRWVNTYDVTPPANTPTTGSFDGANHLIVNSAQPDASGNLGQIGGPSGIQYTYDGENRVVTVTSLATSTTVASYAYDGEGRRVQRVSGGATTTYVYDAKGELAAEYVTGTAPAAPCTTCYLTVDHLGSTRMMTDNRGTLVALHDFRPFGEEVPGGVAGRSSSLYGQTDNPRQKFTGKERDSELANSADPYGLDYFGARYFSGAQGRFTSADPMGIMEQKVLDPQQWNMYAYVRNNPLRLVDPTGMYTCQGNKDQCRRVESAYNEIKAAAAKNTGLNKVLEFLGEPGKANNVAIKFGSLKPGVFGKADTTSSTDLMGTTHTTTQITLDLKQTDAVVKGRGGEFGAASFEVGGLLAHEGSHGKDQFPLGHNPTTKAAERTTEMNAYGAQSEVYMGLGLKSRVDPGLSSDSQTDREKAIRDGADRSTAQWCQDRGGC
jgi:RHS repeat-associated protein